MLLTEEAARAKWCPHAMVSAKNGDNNPNRYNDGTPHKSAMCIASYCMSWRALYNMNSGVAKGYCGQAGHP